MLRLKYYENLPSEKKNVLLKEREAQKIIFDHNAED